MDNDIDENPEHWWTDCHIHAVVTDFHPTPEQAAVFLSDLGATKILCCAAHPQPDVWDSEVEPAPTLAEWEECPVATITEALSLDGVAVVTCLLDPADCGLLELCQDFTKGTRQDWEACAVTLGIGPCTIPDLDHDGTAAKFAFSLSIGGPGYPRNADRLVRQMPKLPLLTAATKRIGDLVGQRCTTHLSLSYTGGLDDAAEGEA